MTEELAVAEIERLVVDEEADDLAVGDVHEGLPGLGVPVARLGVRQRPQLVERVEVRARESKGLALVQIGPHADVPVREGEHRLGPGEHVEIEVRLAYRPGLDGEGGPAVHPSSSSSPRSETTRSAPSRRSASLWPVRSTPTTKPKPPARPAATPASASSKTAASTGWTFERPRCGKKCVRSGLAPKLFRCGAGGVDSHLEQPVETGRLEGGAAVRAGGDDRKAQARVPHRPHVQRRSLECLEPAFADQDEQELVLAVAERDHRGLVGVDPAREEEPPDAVVARPPVDVELVVGNRIERHMTFTGAPGTVGQKGVERRLPGLRVQPCRLRQHPVEVEQARPDAGRQAEPAHGLSTSECRGRRRFLARLAHESSVGPTKPSPIGENADRAEGSPVHLSGARGRGGRASPPSRAGRI